MKKNWSKSNSILNKNIFMGWLLKKKIKKNISNFEKLTPPSFSARSQNASRNFFFENSENFQHFRISEKKCPNSGLTSKMAIFFKSGFALPLGGGKIFFKKSSTYARCKAEIELSISSYFSSNFEKSTFLQVRRSLAHGFWEFQAKLGI